MLLDLTKKENKEPRFEEALFSLFIDVQLKTWCSLTGMREDEEEKEEEEEGGCLISSVL